MMKTENEKEDREQIQEQIVCRGFIYNLLAAALQSPGEETLNELLQEKTRASLSVLAAGLTEAGNTAAGGAVAAWAAEFNKLTPDGMRTGHARLFGHTARGIVCPYETEYGHEGAFQQPRQLGKIAGFYSAFGLTLRKDERERADHISCELEFMAFLSRKEAYALEHHDGEMLEATQKAVRLFLRDHLGRFGRAFGRLLRKEDAAGFFGKLGDVLYEFITIECLRLHFDPGPALLPLRSAEEAAVPMACGSREDDSQ